MTRRYLSLFIGISAGGLLSACSPSGDRAIDVVLVKADAAESGEETLAGSSSASALLRAATTESIVDFDAEGRISPGLAESWIVTADGLSYIFRLRELHDEDGAPYSAAKVKALFSDAIKEQQGTSFGLDLAIIDAVYARTGRVIEIRLKTAMPQFLNLLADARLSLDVPVAAPHALLMEREDDAITLLPQPAVEGELPSEWTSAERLELRTMAPRDAVEFFQKGRADALLGGNIDALPFVQTGGLLRGAIRLDPVTGLFGLVVREEEGFLGDPQIREAIAMAINRNSLITPFNIGGWVPTNRLVPASLSPGGVPVQRWQGLELDDLRTAARARINAWQGQSDAAFSPITIALPEGRAGTLLFDRLRIDMAAIGLELERRGPDDDAQLVLIDEVASYDSPRWFLNRLSCRVEPAACSAPADDMVAESLTSADPAIRQARLAEAEALISQRGGYIPFGPPIRFSLVRGSVGGFAVNGQGVHPLPPLAFDPT